MGVYIDYAFRTQCSEEKMLAALGRLRERLLELGLPRVGEVQRVAPAFSHLAFDLMAREGLPLPSAVTERLGSCLETDDRLVGLAAAPPAFHLISPGIERRFFAPVRELMARTDLWRPEDYPAAVRVGQWTLTREGMMFAFAELLLRHGYVLVVDPAEGCESVCIGLTTIRGHDKPLWLGSGSTKTQYATPFVAAHERVCRVLDLAKREKLLYKACDATGFYRHRDWGRSARIVNRKNLGTLTVAKQLEREVEEARQAGRDVEILRLPVLDTCNLLCVRDETPV